MTSKKLWTAMLVIVLALGMTAVGCSKGSKSSGSSGGEKAASSGMPGTLKITGLPEKKYQVLVVSMDKDLSSVGRVAFAITSTEAMGDVSSGGNVFKLELYKAGGGAWTVTGKRQVVLILMGEGEAFDAKNQAIRTATVNFSKGSATVKCSSFTAVTK